MSTVKPELWWVRLAYRVVADYFDQDLGAWSSSARTRVLVAALDAEQLGEHAVDVAVHDAAKAIVTEWRRKMKARQRRAADRDEEGRI